MLCVKRPITTIHFGQIGNSEMKRMECCNFRKTFLQLPEILKMFQIQKCIFFLIASDFEYLQYYTSYKIRRAFPQCAFTARAMLCTLNNRSFTIKYSLSDVSFKQPRANNYIDHLNILINSATELTV